MKSLFVRYYLLAIAVLFVATALAKLPAISPAHIRTWCLDDPILGNFQPPGLSNEQLLGIAATVELAIVGLICFSPWRWLPCLAATIWGLACYFAHLFFIDPNAKCRCLGWLMQPNPANNQAMALLALGIAGGGWLAFRTAWNNRENPPSALESSS